MRPSIVMGNWKMNGSLSSVTTLLQDLTSLLPEDQQSLCVVFPPSIYLQLARSLLQETSIQIGAQNFYPANQGAFTGEVSASMLNDYACRYVLVGHSERRHLFGEDDHFIAKKFHHAKEHGMIPVLCVGETLSEREDDLTHAVIARQLRSVMQLSDDAFKGAIIAYEPVWAIGTGKTASASQAQEVHEYIRTVISESEALSPKEVMVLYGGSVNEKNASSLFSMPDIDGGLVGGASLDARQFVEIVKCIS